MAEYIERSEAVEFVKNNTPSFGDTTTMQCVERSLANVPAADVVEVVHGEWILETHSFYADTWDESIELVVYITANCSKCDQKHPDEHEVYSKRLYAPEDVDENLGLIKKRKNCWH